MAMCHILLGQEQEIIELFGQDDYTKKLAALVSGLQLKHILYILPELKSEEFFVEAIQKSELWGKTRYYFKIIKENKLIEKEIKDLLDGNHITGYDFWTNNVWSIDGTNKEGVVWNSGKTTDHIKVWVEDDQYCRKWDTLYRGLPDCSYVYKNPDGSLENKDEYILVADYGFFGFSVID